MQAIFAYLFTRFFIKIKVLNLHTKQIYKYKSLYILFFKRITPERTLAKVYALIVLSQKKRQGNFPCQNKLKACLFLFSSRKYAQTLPNAKYNFSTVV